MTYQEAQGNGQQSVHITTLSTACKACTYVPEADIARASAGEKSCLSGGMHCRQRHLSEQRDTFETAFRASRKQDNSYGVQSSSTPDV